MRHYFLLALVIMRSWAAQAQCGACQFEAQVIANGAFSSGNSGFTTSYAPGTGFFCPLCDDGTYAVGTNAIFFHSDFLGADHTNPPFGNFMIVNGSDQSGAEVWCQTVAVQPDTEYEMVFWARDVTNNPDPHPLAQLAFTIDGVQVGSVHVDEGGWTSNTVAWNSGVATTIDVCIVNYQNQTGGNDFGIDDISMTGCHDYQLLHAAEAGADAVLCSGETATIGEPAHVGYTYSWDNATGLTGVSSSMPGVSLLNEGPGALTETYVLTADSAAVGCVTTDTVTVTILPVPGFSLGADLQLCPGGQAELVLEDLGWDSIAWSDGSTGMSVVTDGEGWYWVTVTAGECGASDSLWVEETDLPEIGLADFYEACETEGITLGAPVVVSWSSGITGLFFSPGTSGTYWCSYEQDGCTTSDTAVVVLWTMPVLSLPSDTILCENSAIVLDASVDVSWNTGDTGSELTVTEQGNYTAIAENGLCVAVASVDVMPLASPEVELGAQTFACEGSEVVLSAYATQHEAYLWSNGETGTETGISASGLYWVIASNLCGAVSDTVEVFFSPCGFDLFIPNAFTPNGDPDNEGWFVSGYNIKQIEIFVYNRLGDVIFKANALHEEWQPGYLLPGDDVYNYFVRAVSVSGEETTRTGHIYLLR